MYSRQHSCTGKNFEKNASSYFPRCGHNFGIRAFVRKPSYRVLHVVGDVGRHFPVADCAPRCPYFLAGCAEECISFPTNCYGPLFLRKGFAQI